MIGVVGLDPDKFWSYTLRHNELLAKAHIKKQEEKWAMTRNIEFSNYNTTFGAMSGKPIFKNISKPADLYRLSMDDELEKQSAPKYDLERAQAARDRAIKARQQQ